MVTPRLLIMRFPRPGRLPGSSGAARWLFGVVHGFYALSLLYPYMGPVFMLPPLALALVFLRKRLPFDTHVAYRFMLQRLGLILLLTTLSWLVLFKLEWHNWQVIYFTLLPLCVADAVAAFRGDVGLFYWQGRHD